MTTEMLNWWSERWLTWGRALGLGPQTEGQARSAHRLDGQVRLQKGKVTARVWVSERRQVEAFLKVRPWGERDWRKLLDAVATQPDVAQRMLSGRMGAELEAVATELGLALFPPTATVGCACDKKSIQCRHLNYLLAETAGQLAANPFLWLAVLGQERQELLAALRDRLSDRRPVESSPANEESVVTLADGGEPLDLARFWEPAADPLAVPVRAGAGSSPDALLRSLGPLEVGEPIYLPPERAVYPLHTILQRMVKQVGQAATALALGEEEPAFRGGSLPGKPVSLAARLAPEVEAVLREGGAMRLVDELYELCPTARTLGDEAVAHRHLLEACQSLPHDLVLVAGRYAGPARSLLQGAEFQHVVTFDEWLSGDAADDGDWVRGLAAAGWARPSLAPWFERNQPQVGDLLRIRLEERLVVELLPRAERDPTALLQSDAVAARLLQALTGFAPRGALSEQEMVAALLAEGGYREGLHPDPLWLVAHLSPGLYSDPVERAITRQPTAWRPGFARYVYGVWPRRDDRLRSFQAGLMKRWATRQQIETATACITWWNRLWPGAQDEPGVKESLGSFLHFLWNVAPREAARHKLPVDQVPLILADWFRFLADLGPAMADAVTPHLRAISMREHYAERVATAPPDGSSEGQVLAWQAEGFRWIGPGHFFAGGGYH